MDLSQVYMQKVYSSFILNGLEHTAFRTSTMIGEAYYGFILIQNFKGKEENIRSSTSPSNLADLFDKVVILETTIKTPENN